MRRSLQGRHSRLCIGMVGVTAAADIEGDSDMLMNRLDFKRRHLTLALCLLAAAGLLGCPDTAAQGDTLDPDIVDVVGDVATDITTDISSDTTDISDAQSDGPSDIVPDVPAGPVTLTSGGATVTIDEIGIHQVRGDQTFDLPWTGFVFGTTTMLDPDMNYDPGYLYPGLILEDFYTPPAGLAWTAANAASWVHDTSAGVVTVSLDHEGGRASVMTISAVSEGEGHFVLQWTAVDDGGDIPVFYRIMAPIEPQERFYGLGEFFDHVEHHGRRRYMQFEAAELESGYNEMHVPIPLLIATSGWGLFVETYRAGVFDMGLTTPQVAEITFGLGPAGFIEGLKFRLFSATHPMDLTKRYYDATGYPGPYADWALGPWIWRDEVADQAAVEQDLTQIRAMDLATTGYWIDRPYASAVNSFDFEPTNYPDPQAMINMSQDLGMRMALWHTPYTDPDDPDSVDLFDYATANNFFAPKLPTAVANWGPPLDFSAIGATEWWQTQIDKYTSMGIEGFKLDYGQEVIIGAVGARFASEFNDGTDERTMHRRYAILYHKAYAEMLPPTGGFLLCRSASWGDQVNGTIIWPGDIDASFDKHGVVAIDQHDGTEFNAVGGLPAAVVAGSTLGPSGFPLFGADTGGYRHSPPNKELYVRWIGQSALSPLMQVGTNTNDLPWSFGDPKILDQEVLDWYRTYARLHLRMWPYIWTYLQRIAQDGRAIQRPLGLAHPELESHPDDVYLLGDHLLVPAVVEAGVTERTFALPEGEWINWWTGTMYTGSATPGSTVTVPAPLGSLPMLVRAGTPLPLLRETIDTIAPVADSTLVDSFHTTPHPLWAWVAPGPDGSFELFDGTILGQSRAGGVVSLTRTAGTTFDGPMVWQVVGLTSAEVSAADVDGTPLAVLASRADLDTAESGVFYDDTATPSATLLKLPSLPAAGATSTVTLTTN